MFQLEIKIYLYQIKYIYLENLSRKNFLFEDFKAKTNEVNIGYLHFNCNFKI